MRAFSCSQFTHKRSHLTQNVPTYRGVKWIQSNQLPRKGNQLPRKGIRLPQQKYPLTVALNGNKVTHRSSQLTLQCIHLPRH